MNGIPAKPTLYRDILFRSRLEATWAAFFDIVGWNWIYEPEICDGYIPDFQIIGAARNIVVEVKPQASWAAFSDEIRTKASAASHLGELLILTDYQHEEDCVHVGAAVIGWFPEDGENAVLNHHTGYDLIHSWGSWEERLSGSYDGNAGITPVSYREFLKLWSQALNQTQWRAPRHPKGVA